MFARYDYSNFPEVRVFFTGSINTEEDFTLFTDQWIKLYKDKQNFTFLFDMKDITMVNPRYCYKMALFINKLKQESTQYLTYSKIIHINNYISYLLYIIFSIQKPVAPVDIVSNDGTITRIDV